MEISISSDEEWLPEIDEYSSDSDNDSSKCDSDYQSIKSRFYGFFTDLEKVGFGVYFHCETAYNFDPKYHTILYSEFTVDHTLADLHEEVSDVSFKIQSGLSLENYQNLIKPIAQIYGVTCYGNSEEVGFIF